MKNLEGLNNIFQLIADKLGIAIETVEANAEFYILEYGRYMAYKNLIPNMGIGLLIVTLLLFIFLFVSAILLDIISPYYHGYNGSLFEVLIKYKKVIIPLFTLVFLITTFHDLIFYNISPLMYSLERIMSLIN